jgi:hypothetical protein
LHGALELWNLVSSDMKDFRFQQFDERGPVNDLYANQREAEFCFNSQRRNILNWRPKDDYFQFEKSYELLDRLNVRNDSDALPTKICSEGMGTPPRSASQSRT